MKTKLTLAIFGILIAMFLTNCETRKRFWQGEILYHNFCENCHMEDGTGLRGLIPPLANADFVKNDPVRMACIIRYGMKGEVIVNDTTYSQEMPGVPKLTDFEITNVINYINQAWGNDYGYVKFEEVKKALEGCEK
ncbi:MAG: cytochrome c [Saprospiraceae bacterium]|nr:cytochrome c [Saprospiraceae bacterium]